MRKQLAPRLRATAVAVVFTATDEFGATATHNLTIFVCADAPCLLLP